MIAAFFCHVKKTLFAIKGYFAQFLVSNIYWLTSLSAVFLQACLKNWKHFRKLSVTVFLNRFFMLSEDFVLFFRSLYFDPFLFFGSLEVYLYIGITSLCLYNITSFFIFQVVILAKVNKFRLCKRQISAHSGSLCPENR